MAVPNPEVGRSILREFSTVQEGCGSVWLGQYQPIEGFRAVHAPLPKYDLICPMIKNQPETAAAKVIGIEQASQNLANLWQAFTAIGMGC